MLRIFSTLVVFTGLACSALSPLVAQTTPISDEFCEKTETLNYVLSKAESIKLDRSKYHPNNAFFEYSQTQGLPSKHYCAYSFAYKQTWDFGIYAVFFDFSANPPNLIFRDINSGKCVGC